MAIGPWRQVSGRAYPSIGGSDNTVSNGDSGNCGDNPQSSFFETKNTIISAYQGISDRLV